MWILLQQRFMHIFNQNHIKSSHWEKKALLNACQDLHGTVHLVNTEHMLTGLQSWVWTKILRTPCLNITVWELNMSDKELIKQAQRVPGFSAFPSLATRWWLHSSLSFYYILYHSISCRRAHHIHTHSCIKYRESYYSSISEWQNTNLRGKSSLYKYIILSSVQCWDFFFLFFSSSWSQQG